LSSSNIKRSASFSKNIENSYKGIRESFEDYCSGTPLDNILKNIIKERRNYSNKKDEEIFAGTVRAKSSNPAKHNMTAINRYKRAIVIETDENLPLRKDLPKFNKRDAYTTPQNNIDKFSNKSNSGLTYISDTTSFNPIFSYEQDNPVQYTEDTNFDKEWLNDYLESTAPLEIRPGEYSTAKSGKQRRTREERNKKISKLEVISEGNHYDTVGSNKQLKKHNSSKFLITVTPKNITLTRRAKSGVKPALNRNETSKNICKVSQASQEKTKGMQKSASKLTSSNGRKNYDPKRYIARRYLCELYEKVMYKVKELERDKKINAPQKKETKKGGMRSCRRNKSRRMTNSNIKCT